MLFCIYCLDKPGHEHVRADTRAAHLAYAGKLQHVAIGGPLLSDDGERMIGSMVVADFPDRAAAEAFVANDPYAAAGLFESVTIRPYKKVLP